jgi:hypothetical protein
MKTTNLVMSVLLLAGTISANVTLAADTTGIILRDPLTDGSYCHMKFPAIREETLNTSQPVLKNADAGDIIDFYGSCSHDPLGNEEVHGQLHDLQRRRARDYMN